MPNLVDIPTVVGTLVTLAASGGTEAAVEAVKGITINGALKLADLRDDLFNRQDVAPVVQRVQQNPLDPALKQELENILTTSLQNHPAFAQFNAIGDVKADRGGVAVGVNSGDISVSNNGKKKKAGD